MEPMKPSGRHHPQGAEHRNELHMAEVSEQNVNMTFRIPPPFPASPTPPPPPPHTSSVCAPLFIEVYVLFFLVIFYAKSPINLIFPPT